MFNDYKELERHLCSMIPKEFTLTHFQNFLESIGNPQKDLKCIHIGGTNGKGSTTNYIRCVLQDADYKVATFTSPSFSTKNDSICINAIAVDPDKMLELYNQFHDSFVAYNLTSFEIEVAIALIYFKEQDVDITIFEVGLGGKDDATNVIEAMISVITNVSLDHTDYLGDTCEKIASVKSGIIKSNSTFMTTEPKQECLSIFKDVCNKKNSDFVVIDSKCDFQIHKSHLEYNYMDLSIKLKTIAQYQISNSILAIEVCVFLKDKMLYNISSNNIKKGIENASWPMRFEIMSQYPLVILDGAHNPSGIDALIKSSSVFEDCTIIFSSFKDKDVELMYKKLVASNHNIVVTLFEHYRACSLNDYHSFGIVNVANCYKREIDEALKTKKTVIITGSLSFVSLAKKYLLYKKEESTF